MRRSAVATLVLVVLVIAAAAYQYFRPLPSLQMKTLQPTSYKVPGKLKINWPSQGSAAIAVQGVGVMGSSNGNQVMPLASVAKMMTAYLTLKNHPLGIGATGPTITITAADVATYNADNAQGDSVAPVTLGEKLTERQLLEALLLPSGDNIATLLAQWNAGSVSKFVAEMNQTAKQLGMTHTHYADPAGVNTATVGSALDQIKLAEVDMANPSFASIVSKPQVTLPYGPTQYNTDYVLGHSGIIGIKTGSMPQAGGNFVFATQPKVNGKPVMIIGAVLGQQGLSILTDALNAGVSLAQQAQANLQQVPVLQSGAKAAAITAPWGQNSGVMTTKGVSFIGWPGMVVKETVKATAPKGPTLAANTTVGHLVLKAGSQTADVPLQSAGAITTPSWKWKLQR